MDIETLKDINNSPHEFDVKTCCAVCRNSRGVKKKVFYLCPTRSCRCCVACILRFPSTTDLLDWLRIHVVYGPRGKILDFSKEPQRGLVETKESDLK